MPVERPNPDALLARLHVEAERSARGRLKIFFGMAPGVGKTYAMLEAARKVAKEGVDVVIGYVEPHARPETHALVMGLDLLPKRMLSYHGRTIAEFDLEAALVRRPQLMLVDELAHTNAEGCTHTRRWQDVEDLLSAGIDVFTTLNVQHLESLNDVVTQVTTIAVRETVPDRIFEEADEVELVDLAPDDLIERLKEGKVYVSEQALRAIENFFRKGNLIALRELALRKTADRVSAQAVDYRMEHDVAPIWQTSERLLVCVGPSPMSARLVRATKRMAAGLRVKWTALHIELESSRSLSPEDQLRLEANLRLAEELGATVAHVTGATFATAVLDYARAHNMTRIIVGKPQRSRWRDFWRGAMVYELIRNCGETDIYVISGDDVSPTPVKAASRRESWHAVPYLMATAVVSACTCLCLLLPRSVEPTNIAMIHLTAVVGVSLWLGRGPSIWATILGVLAFDVLFVPPYFRLTVSDSQYLLTFSVMLCVGVLISELATRIRVQRQAAVDRERRTAALLALSRELSELPTRDAVAQAAQRIIGVAFDAHVTIFAVPEAGSSAVLERIAGDESDDRDQAVMHWVATHREAAGAGTDTLPGSTSLFMPLCVQDSFVGVLGIRRTSDDEHLLSQQMQLLAAFVAQLAAALERCRLAVLAETIRVQARTERMRNSLLSAVSHDLRTPLATIAGAAEVLREQSGTLTEPVRLELADSIVDEADRLHRLVANLLDLTRLEAGAIPLRRELQPLDDVIGMALRRLERQLRGHRVELHVPPNLPPVAIDELLMQQVFVNLLDNASKFSPQDTTIEIHAQQHAGVVTIGILDRGTGLVPGDELRIFEKFQRGAEATGRSGSGIGLAICRGIVELHGGRITAESRPGGGAAFRFTIPLTA